MIHERLEVKTLLMWVKNSCVDCQSLPDVKIHGVDQLEGKTFSVFHCSHLFFENITVLRKKQIKQFEISLLVSNPDKLSLVLLLCYIGVCNLEDFLVVSQNESKQLE